MTASGQISHAGAQPSPPPRSAALRRPHPYPALLAQAWQDAQAPRAPDAPTVVSLFAGRGGSTTGYRMAGYHELLAVEWDAHAAETLRLNHPGLDVYHGDIAALPVAEVLQRSGLDVGQLDLLDGSPPCFPAGTPVITARGTVPIEQIQEGDLVLTHTGVYQPVEEVMARPYTGSALTIQTKYGRAPVGCTPEHPFWVRRRVQVWNGRFFVRHHAAPEWLPANQIQAGDLLCEPHVQEGADFLLPAVTYKQQINVEGQSGSVHREVRLDEKPCRVEWRSRDVAWILGFYLAEGHVRGRSPTIDSHGPFRREVIFSVAHHEAPDLVRRLAGVGLHGMASPHSQGASRVTVSSPDLWTICNQLGHGAANIVIPEAFQGMPVPWRLSLLDGYFAGDGCVVRSRRVSSAKRKATTVSRSLAEGVARLVASTIGLVASIERLYRAGQTEIQGRTVQVRETYSVGYALPGSSKLRPAFVQDAASWVPVRSVATDQHDGAVYNLEVAQDHSYTAGGFAVHNCQGFSLMGARQLDDPRNSLFREYVRLLDGLRPRAFVMENVTGMARGEMRGVYLEAVQALRSAGPGYRTISGILNAASFGVPQWRERLIVIGLREDLGREPTLPQPETTTPVTVRQALADLDTGPDGYLIQAKYLPVFAKIRPGDSFNRIHPKKHLFSNRKIDPDRPSFTVVKTVGVGRDGRAQNGMYHWRWPRLMTIPELKRLGSFPDDYCFAESGDEVRDFMNAWAGIGNSVPPLMTRGIAQHVRGLLRAT